MTILSVLALTLLIHLIKPSSCWMRKEAKNVKLSNIISKYENIAITSCQIKCDDDKSCKFIGLEEDAQLGDLVDCHHIGKNDISDSQDASIKLFVFGRMNNRNDKPTQVSCQRLYELNQNLKSGMYRINPSNPINVYCNMGFASRGWMMIANVTVNSPLALTQAAELTSDDKISNSITELNQVGSGTFRFNAKHL